MTIPKFFTLSFYVFLFVSLVLMIGIKFNLYSFGIDGQTELMSIGIGIGLMTATVFRLLLRDLNTNPKRFFALTLGIMMLAFAAFYVFGAGLKVL